MLIITYQKQQKRIGWLLAIVSLLGFGLSILFFASKRRKLLHQNQLQKILGEKVVGYDIIEELTDIDDWKKAQFDTLVANQVFYSFDERQLSSLMDQLSQYNNDITIIVGISRQGLFNNIGKVIFGNKNAHSLTKITSKEELAILLQHCNLIRKNNIL